MSPTPNLTDLIQSVRDEVADGDPIAQLAKAAEYAADLSRLGDSLLDHFVLQCRQAGLSWTELSTALGVSKQAAHKRFTGLAPTFQRFTVKARSAVQGATDQARGLGHTDIGTGHLLVSLFEPADSLAALALSRLGLRREAVTEELIRRRPRGEAATQGAIPFTAHAKEALRGALEEALELGHNYIGTEHLLLGLQREADYTSAEMLTALGAQKDTVRREMLDGLRMFMAERDKQNPKT
ncbi:MAG TPA: Clp protease N-terminal domain-containing protein [Actinospica sp.]|jgi:hypothetical protein|nr:Clp protease N-terminal domain-containing protein [Actinospica sp.]